MAEVCLNTSAVLKSLSTGLVQDRELSVLPAEAALELTSEGEALSTVIVADEASPPACELVEVNVVTVPVTASADPGTAAISAWALGVMRILKDVVVVAIERGVPLLKDTVVVVGATAKK